MSTLEVSVTTARSASGDDCSMVALAGHATVANSGQVREILTMEGVRIHRNVLLDLSRLASMDWWTALIVVWIGRVLLRRGGSLTLTSPRPEVAGLLNYAGAGELSPGDTAAGGPSGQT